MADSWWDDLLARIFTPGILGQRLGPASNTGPLAGTFGSNDYGFLASQKFAVAAAPEVARQEREANGKPTPTPTPTPTAAQQQAQQNPNLREDEQLRASVNTSVGGVPKVNPLYGNLPQAYAYMGSDRKERGAKGSEKFVKEDKFSSIQNVLADLNTWSEKKRAKFADLAVDAGLLKQATTNYDELEPILASLALRSAKLYERGVKVSPWSLLEKYGKAGGVDGKAGGPITTTTVNRSINLTSPREADALVDAALQQRLGRSPTEKEKKAFLAALNSAEKKEPSITKTTTTTTGAGTENVSSNTSTNTSGGVDVAAFTREWSMGHNKDEAGQYQALSTYMPAFFAALSAPV